MSVSRRRLIAGLSTAPAVVRADTPIQWRMTMVWPKGAPGVGTSAEAFATIVYRMAGGRLEITVHGAGEIAGSFEAFDAVLNGRAALFHGSPYFWTERHAALKFFSAILFGLTAAESAAWLNHGGGMALWRELYDGFGPVPFSSGNSSEQAGGWFTRPIDSVEDFQGLRSRIAGIARVVLERLGAEAVLLPPGQIGAAMEAGELDAADWVGPWNDIAMGLYQWAPIYYMPGWHELSAMIETAAAAATEQTLGDFVYHNAAAYPQLAELGVDVRAFPDVVVDRLRSETAEVVAELGTEDDLGQRINASYRDFLAKARACAPHALQGFLNLRDG